MDKVLGFVKFPENAKAKTITELDLADILEKDPEKFLNISLVATNLLQDGQIRPHDVMQLFCDCVESGVYPPTALLKIIAGYFEKFLSACCDLGHPTLDELLKVSGNKALKEDLLKVRNQAIYIDTQRLINIGLSKAQAYTAICEKYQTTFKSEVTSVKLKNEITVKRVEQIYKAHFAKWGNIYNRPAVTPSAASPSSTTMPTEEEILSSFPSIARKIIKDSISQKGK